MASTDARPVPRKNAAFRHYFCLRNSADGTLITSWTSADSEVSLDGASFSDCTNEATEIGTTGCGYIDLTSGEMNADAVLYKLTVTNTGAIPYVVTFFPEEVGDYRANVEQFGGTNGTFSSGRPEVNTTHISGNTATADNLETLFGANLILGTATAGAASTLTMATGVTYGTNILARRFITIVAGTGVGQSRMILSNTNATPSVITVDNAWTTNPSTDSVYLVYGHTGSDVRLYQGSNVPVQANVTQFGSSAGSFSGGIPAVNVTQFGGTNGTFSGGLPAVNLVDGGITAAKFAASSITSTVIATGAIDADALATDAVNEIVDAVWDEATSGHTTAGTTGKALTDAGSAGDPWGTAVPGAYSAGTAGYILGTNLDATVSSRSTVTTAQVNSEVDTALADINLDHLVKSAVDTNFATTVHLDSVIGHLADNGTSATFDRTTDSLEVLGAAAPPSAASIADAVWDEALSGHLSAGSTGEALNAAGGAGDPWVTSLPGSYSAGQAGYIVGNNLNATVSSRASQTTADAIETDTQDIQSRLPAALVSGRMAADMIAVSGDTVAADNLEAAADGTGYNLGGGSIVAASVTGAVGSVTGNVGGNVVGSVASVTGNVGGNVVGSVASVTGAVGSVTGNVGGNVTGSVGSVTGNVGGNVAGSVASVTGAVGSVTGNVGGNVTGSIGSLATQAKADVNAEMDSALADINLDHLAKNAVDTNFATTVHLDSILGQMADNGTSATFDRTTDSLEAIANTGGSLTVDQAGTLADLKEMIENDGTASAAFTTTALANAGGGGGGVNVIMPPITAVSTERAEEETLRFYVGETINATVTILDADGDAVDLSSYTLRLVFEKPDRTDLSVIESGSITVSGSGSNIITFAVPSTLTTKERMGKWSLRHTTNGMVLAGGVYHVEYRALKDV